MRSWGRGRGPKILSNQIEPPIDYPPYFNANTKYRSEPFCQYLEGHEELWARAYTQYVVTRYDDKQLRKDYYAQYGQNNRSWKGRDFKSIHDLFHRHRLGNTMVEPGDDLVLGASGKPFDDTVISPYDADEEWMPDPWSGLPRPARN